MFNDYGLNPYDDTRDPHELDHDTRDDADTHEQLDEYAWLTDDDGRVFDITPLDPPLTATDLARIARNKNP